MNKKHKYHNVTILKAKLTQENTTKVSIIVVFSKINYKTQEECIDTLDKHGVRPYKTQKKILTWRVYPKQSKVFNVISTRLTHEDRNCFVFLCDIEDATKKRIVDTKTFKHHFWALTNQSQPQLYFVFSTRKFENVKQIIR